MHGRTFALLAAAAAGAGISVAEVSATRLVAPWFGSSLTVWTAVVGVVMAALAVGGYAGGRAADRWPADLVLRRALGAGGVGLCLAPAVASWVLGQGTFEAAASLVGAVLGAAAVVALPAALLAAAVPAAARSRCEGGAGVGGAVGSAWAAAAAGGVAGVFVPALVTVPLLGTARGMDAAGAALLGLVAWYARPLAAESSAARAVRWTPTLVALLLTAVGPRALPPWALRPGWRLLELVESPYHVITVLEQATPEGPRRSLLLNEGLTDHSRTAPAGAASAPLVGEVWDRLSLVPALLTGATSGPLEVCIVGLAGGTVSTIMDALLAPRLQVRMDGIELDPGVVAAGRAWFALDKPGLTVIVDDGRVALRRSTKRYDVLVVDAFRQPYIPFHLVTREFLELAREHLTLRGVFAMNVGALSERSTLVRHVAATAAAAFPHVSCVHQPGSATFILLGSLAPFEPARLEPRPGSLAAALVAGRAGPAVAEALRASLACLGPVDPAGATPFTDDEAPVEVLTESDILEGLGQVFPGWR